MTDLASIPATDTVPPPAAAAAAAAAAPPRSSSSSSSSSSPSSPSSSSSSSPPPRGQTLVLRECAICQTSIYPDEETQPCSKCGLVYHSECWQENYGCAAYGCEQVNALAPKVDIPAAPVELSPPIEAPVEALPWDFLLLGASALAMVASTLSYGLPSLLIAAAVAWRMQRMRTWRDRILIAAALLCVAGIVGGVLLSRFWFTQVDYTTTAAAR